MESSGDDSIYNIEPYMALDTDPLLGDMGLNSKQMPSATHLVNHEGSKLKQYIGTVAVTFSAMSAGTTMGWTSPASIIKDGNTNSVEFLVTNQEWQWVTSCLALGAMIACLPVGTLVDVLGRKRLMLFLVPFMLLGWAALIWPKSIWMLYLGRLLVGGVSGAFCIVTPTYIGEIAESSIRGILGSFFQLQITIGILIVYFLGYVAPLLWVSLICATIPIVFFVFTLCLPESPRWLLANDRREDARKALRFYRGDGYDVDREIEDSERALEEERAQKTSCTQSFATTAAKKALVLALGAMLFQQLSGVNAVIFNVETIFKDAGSSMDPQQSAILVGICQVVFTGLSGLVIDRLGRKILLFASGLVMAICSVLLGVYFYLKSNGNDVSNIGWLPLVCLNGFIALFSIGYGPIPWVYMAEISPPQIKGTAVSIATIVNWTCAFIVTLFFESISAALGTYSTFWIFGGISAAGCVFVLTMLLETKGKSLEQIQDELDPQAAAARRARNKV